VGRRVEPLLEFLQHRVGDGLDVRLSPAQLLDLRGVDVEAQDAEALQGEQADERQAHVAEPDDADDRLARANELFDGHWVLSARRRTSRAASMWPRSTVREGRNRIPPSPQPRRRSPSSNAALTMRLRRSWSSGPCLPRRMSMDCMRPRPCDGPTWANSSARPSRPAARTSPIFLAFSMKLSSISSIVRSPAAQAIALPPNVLAWAPLGQTLSSFRAMIAPSGRPPPIGFAQQRMSGSTPKCSTA